MPGARVSFATIGSPASAAAVTASGESFLSRSFSAGVAGASLPFLRAEAEAGAGLIGLDLKLPRLLAEWREEN